MTIEIDERGNVIGYLSVPQYCKKYGVKETTARQWCNRNMIPHIKVGRETWIKDGTALGYIQKPLAWALYQVWQEVDKAESEDKA